MNTTSRGPIALIEYKPEAVPVMDPWRTLRLKIVRPEVVTVRPQASRQTVGRPKLFRTKMVEDAQKLAGLGLTEEQIALYFSISVRTLIRWKRNKPEFCHALLKGKQDANISVKQKLYRLTQLDGAKGQLGAIVFWLTNMAKEDGWRNPAQIQQTNTTVVAQGKGHNESHGRFTGEDAEFQGRILTDLSGILKV